MPATNAIGQGAVILTANADSLLDGLSKAEKATGKWADRTGKAADSNRHAYDALIAKGHKLAGYFDDIDYTKGFGVSKNRKAYDDLIAKGNKLGDYLGDVDYTKPIEKAVDKLKKEEKDAGKGGLVGGLLFGAGVGVALAGVNLLAGGAGKLLERLSEVGERSKQYGNIDVSRRLRIDRAAKGFDRISAAADDFYFRVAEKLAPVIEKVATVLEVAAHVGAAGFDLLADSTGKAISFFGDLIGATDSFGDAGETATQRTFNGLRNVAKGLQQVHNLLGTVGEFGLDSVGMTIQPYATQLKLFDDLAGTNFAAVAAKEYEKVLKVRERFSKAANLDIDKEFDLLQKSLAATERIKKSSGVTLAGAYGSASNDAQSIIAKFQAANVVTGQVAGDNPLQVAKEQLKEMRDLKRGINKLVQRAERTVPLEILP